MGGFFTNVQVHVGFRSPGEVRDSVVETLRDLALDEGFGEVPEGMAAERTILVGPAGTDPWIGVYDEFTESQDLESLEQLAKSLSKVVGGYTLAVLVHDSDVLQLRLYRKGKKVDAYSSDPEYFGGVSQAQRRALRGRQERWTDLLGGKPPEDLRAIWSEPSIFAEDTLIRVGTLIGLPAEKCRTGFNYLVESGLDSSFHKLAFRSSRTAPAKTEHPVRLLTGPPQFASTSGGGEVRCCSGDPLDYHLLHVHVHNNGGPAIGVGVRLAGEALDRGLFEPAAVQVFVRGDHSNRLEVVPDDSHRGNNGEIWVHWPDLVVPPGEEVSLESLSEAFRGMSARQLMAELVKPLKPDDRPKSTVTVRVKGSARRPGDGILRISVIPLENIEDGGYSEETRITVYPQPRRPLQAVRRDPHSSLSLRQMEQPATLFALAILGGEQTSLGPLLASAFERWAGLLRSAVAWRCQLVWTTGPDARFKSRTVSSSAIPRSKTWQELRQLLGTSPQLIGEFRPELPTVTGPHLSLPPSSGFSLYAMDHSPSPGVGEWEVLPHVSCWLNLAEVDADTARNAGQVLVSIVDDLCAQGRGTQAFMGRWDWRPEYLEYTPYEWGCSTEVAPATTRGWVTRFLRGVTRDMWIGPDLLGHIKLADVEAISHTETVGNGVRIRLSEASTLNELERALLPILPTEDAAVEAKDRYRGERGVQSPGGE